KRPALVIDRHRRLRIIGARSRATDIEFADLAGRGDGARGRIDDAALGLGRRKRVRLRATQSNKLGFQIVDAGLGRLQVVYARRQALVGAASRFGLQIAAHDVFELLPRVDFVGLDGLGLGLARKKFGQMLYRGDELAEVGTAAARGAGQLVVDDKA